MLEPIRHPLSLQIMSLISGVLATFSLSKVRFEPDHILSGAMKQSGLSDFGGLDLNTPLDVLCQSIEKDANLNHFGRQAVFMSLTSAIVQRLRMVQLRKDHPECFQTPLIPPVIILGLPRTGSTFLHRLLALGPNARALKTWEVNRPLPPPSAEERRRAEAVMIARIKKLAPALDKKHYADVDEPEECVFLTRDSGTSILNWMFMAVYDYLEWYKRQDHHHVYALYREHLVRFQGETPEQRLTLKAPWHTAHLVPLLAAIPAALLVNTHRDPIPVVNSHASLAYTVHGTFSRGVDVPRLGRANLELMAWLVEQNMAQRAQVGEDRILDIRYDDLVADPLGTVQRIYTRYDLSFDEAYEVRLKDFLAHREKGRFGLHEYAAEDFGLTDAEVSACFADYRARFLEA